MMNSSTRKRQNRGFTLIEVLIGILIFALGMMALAKLQGNLARNSGDSNARTVATNIAEEEIERLRVFRQLDADGVNAAYNDIVPETRTITRAGNEFRIARSVTDYYYQAGTDNFDPTVVAGAGRPDFKRVDLAVTWNTGQEFEVGAGVQTSGRLGSGAIRISDVISSIPSGSGGKATLGATGTSSYAPPVDYSPGANPDIISIQLGANKFKESTTPLPRVIRADELVETTFDVVTYSQDEVGATFLRREEFRAVSCECKLRAPAGATKISRRPTLWDGYDYTEGEFVAKAYGESANNQQSEYCNICCRDHHDGGTGSKDDPNDPGRSRFNAFRASEDYFTEGAFLGDHKHYKRSNSGDLVLANTAGDVYVEACRMIRKDGFWRIAQDLRQEGLNSFPADYLDDDTEIKEYSDYVTGAVSAYEEAVGNINLYEFAPPPSLTLPASMPTPVVFPASNPAIPTQFAVDGTTRQQLRARGIYIDYLSDVLRTRINCLDAGGSGVECKVPDVNSALEIIPFYDVQLTWLARWNESPTNFPIDVSNQAIADDNAHSRGMAVMTSGVDGATSTISSRIHSGNLGLTGTDPIDLKYGLEEKGYNLHAVTGLNGAPPALSGVIITGTITSSVGGVKAADVEIVATGAACDRTNTGFRCNIYVGATNPRMTVSQYFKNTKDLFACSTVLSINGTNHSGTIPSDNWTRFNLPKTATSNANIVIKLDSCGFAGV